MKPISLKTGLAALILTATATATSGILAACSKSPTSPTQAPNITAATQANNKQDAGQSGRMDGMNHGMNHNMSMDLGPADADYDLRFIDGMTVHHQGAVNMAKDVLNKSQRPEMKKLANNIIAAQNREINQMKQWRKTWYAKADSTPMAYQAQMGHMMPMTPEQMQSMMMSMDLGAADAEFDLRFLHAMIPHHEGALVMAQDALKKSKRPEMKKLSQEILTSQKQEIEQMKQWRQAWYKK
ncbi:MAG: DUF305 domain-containing protein [Microcoleus sp. PH2017_10_PVI_O_A]|uniref:DUF305 domain-containing protein n=1 Tax=unclassified Microcoleus TaxID=2642155 RepID=UPI001D46F870|nr:MULTISPECIES: DUF305 domain-containing protein [unclassified Microcoleus]TAE85340.1 MAG: DUF305 domain-containing protein [Oscillatoriales cyanobacterium]MCC3404754.1 DUF305 domain-containing protein [Microcoleus sp. PH2017_10_PVI_O_A]MCC3458823.1 DUF305 domain-containing protein [Microcoleus sp. PH2017_11_PCY_U_A]MCC3477020.1 DUF305 domain-containing protein [Microcoleus sp. PH2017_12_PCY_D_A]MCC3527506.1 DUF305 domain-containing protein [Microcoleus sp. PH2017_21_RUC_O_A]